jgi:hypothetical protein
MLVRLNWARSVMWKRQPVKGTWVSSQFWLADGNRIWVEPERRVPSVVERSVLLQAVGAPLSGGEQGEAKQGEGEKSRRQ